MDPVANMLVAIKNAYLVGKLEVFVPFSNFKMSLAKTLEREKFVGKVTKKDKEIKMELLYENHKPKLTQIKRVSKLGLRVYSKSKKIEKVKGGRGTYIISTPKGVMSGKEAKAKNLGGEVICRVW